MTHYRISEAAAVLGVSDDTVRRWIDAGTLPVEVDEQGRRVVDGPVLAARAVELAQSPDDPTSVGRSARNRFPGIVTRVLVDGVMAQVEVQSGRHGVVSLLSAEAVHELGLEVGSPAVAVVKATSVLIETPR
ncbi:molybdopterin-binding protein [Agromyces sp. MMS24-K17]|uniref:TOBE domain-containing protein n=1 Tax=Agromyces sp. MMS24-K17 TaxID=3372850 RepID=UPI0037550750